MKFKCNPKALFSQISSNEKLIFISAFLAIIGSFFTWFSTIEIQGVDTKLAVSFNAFSGIGAVLGYFFFICVATSLALVILNQKDKQVEHFLNKQSWIYLFLSGEALFISICALLIYSSYGFSSAYSKIGFGLYLSIGSQVLGVLAAHFYFLKHHKKNKKEEKFNISISKYS